MSEWIAFVPHYLMWHYTRALQNIVRVCANFLWFFYHFFSISFLLKTFFNRFERLGEEYKKGLDVPAFAATLTVNTLMRIVGILARTIVILLGVSVTVTVFLFGIIFFVFWLFLPFMLPLFFIAGVSGISL